MPMKKRTLIITGTLKTSGTNEVILSIPDIEKEMTVENVKDVFLQAYAKGSIWNVDHKNISYIIKPDEYARLTISISDLP